MGILWSLITISLTGTGLWLLLLLIRPVTKNVFSQTWHYYIGLLPLFFLLGGTLLTVPMIQAAQNMLDFSSVQTAAVSTQPANAAALQTALNAGMLRLFMRDVTSGLNSAAIIPYLTALWLFGLLVFAAVQIKNYLIFKNKIFSGGIIVDMPQISVKVIKSPDVATPMLFGILRPVIVLPDFELSGRALDMILLHELLHKKRRDLPIKLCMLMANAIHWFNPLVYIFNRDLETLCEHSCDEQLVRNLELADRKFYGETIISILAYAVAQKSGLYTGFCGSKNKIKRRLSIMLNFRKTRRSLTALSLIAAVTITGFGGTLAFATSNIIEQAEAPWYEPYRQMIAAEEIYINGEKIENFPAFYTRSVELSGVFEENIYIPLTATAEKLGLPVSWDENSSTASVGSSDLKIALKAGEVPQDDLRFGTTQQFGSYLYVAPNFFTDAFGVDFDMNFNGVVTTFYGENLNMTFSGSDSWVNFLPTAGDGKQLKQEEIMPGYQTYEIDLAENLATGVKWVCTVNEELGFSLVSDEYLGPESGATESTAIHRFTVYAPRTAGELPAGTTVFSFTETTGGRQLDYKIAEIPVWE